MPRSPRGCCAGRLSPFGFELWSCSEELLERPWPQRDHVEVAFEDSFEARFRRCEKVSRQVVV